MDTPPGQEQRERSINGSSIDSVDEGHAGSNGRPEQLSPELLDARWEILSLRQQLLREQQAHQPVSSQYLELKNQADTAASERDQLRQMLLAVERDLERERETRMEATEKSRLEVQKELQALQAELRTTEDRVDKERETAHAQLGKAEDEKRSLQARVAAVERELTAVEAELTASSQELGRWRQRWDRLKSALAGKLILPFGASQRKIQNLLLE